MDNEGQLDKLYQLGLYLETVDYRVCWPKSSEVIRTDTLVQISVLGVYFRDVKE